MRLCDAIHIVENIDSNEINDIEKARAILTIGNAETLNSVTKKDLMKIIKWLFDRCFEVET